MSKIRQRLSSKHQEIAERLSVMLSKNVKDQAQVNRTFTWAQNAKPTLPRIISLPVLPIYLIVVHGLLKYLDDHPGRMLVVINVGSYQNLAGHRHLSDPRIQLMYIVVAITLPNSNKNQRALATNCPHADTFPTIWLDVVPCRGTGDYSAVRENLPSPARSDRKH